MTTFGAPILGGTPAYTVLGAPTAPARTKPRPWGSPFPVAPGVASAASGGANDDLSSIYALLANPGKVTMPSFAGYDTPLTQAQINQQANTYVRQYTQPLIDQITDSINRKLGYGNSQIAGYTGSLQQALQGLAGQAGGGYEAAQARNAGMTAALTDLQTQAGAQQAADIGAKMAAINAPDATGKAVNAATKDLAAGAAGATSAYGNADLGALAAAGAAAGQMAGQQAGIAQNTGRVQSTEFQDQLAAQMADKVGAVLAQIPGLTQSIMQQLGDREIQKGNLALNAAQLAEQARQANASNALGKATLIGNLQAGNKDRALQASIAVQTLKEDAAKAGMSAQQFWAQLKSQDKQFYTQLAAQQGLSYAQLQAQINQANADRTANSTTAANSLAAQKAENARQDEIAWYNARTGRISANQGSGGLSPQTKTYAAFADSADAFAKGLYTKVQQPLPGAAGVLGKTTTVMQPPSYADAARRMHARFDTMLKRAGIKQTEIVRLINDALVSNGIYPPNAKNPAYTNPSTW